MAWCVDLVTCCLQQVLLHILVSHHEHFRARADPVSSEKGLEVVHPSAVRDRTQEPLVKKLLESALRTCTHTHERNHKHREGTRIGIGTKATVE